MSRYCQAVMLSAFAMFVMVVMIFVYHSLRLFLHAKLKHTFCNRVAFLCFNYVISRL